MSLLLLLLLLLSVIASPYCTLAADMELSSRTATKAFCSARAVSQLFGAQTFLTIQTFCNEENQLFQENNTQVWDNKKI